jgi:hypothetical protein
MKIQPKMNLESVVNVVIAEELRDQSLDLKTNPYLTDPQNYCSLFWSDQYFPTLFAYCREVQDLETTSLFISI